MNKRRIEKGKLGEELGQSMYHKYQRHETTMFSRYEAKENNKSENLINKTKFSFINFLAINKK